VSGKTAEEITNHAIEVSYKASTDDFKTEAENAIRLLAKNSRPFSADEVWLLLDAFKIKTNNNRALGGVMQRMKNQGVIRSTGALRSGTYKAKITHYRPMRLWEGVR
jgi:hypothetical protein